MKISKFLINLLFLLVFLAHSAAAQVTYTVKRGDSLLKIAKKFNVTTTDIIIKNRLKPPYTIYPGQKLKIPVNEKIYTVKRGDSLEKIAKRFGVSVKELIKLNRLRKPYRIYPGQKLKIPVKRISSNKTTSKKKRETEIITYRVRKGDSIKKIARKFGISEKEVIKLNKLKRPYRIYVGQKLKIPVSKETYLKNAQTTKQNSSKTSPPKYSMLRKVPIYKYYRVRPGDSIGKIARKFGVSVKSIIRTNRLKKPYIIRPGQRLKILIGYKDRLALNRPIEFKMPLDGQIDTTIREKGYKGIFIIAPPGEPVKASEVGIVKFAGKDDRLLKKYGNVVILEHPQGYTTIYASLDKINVKPGQLVHRGEVIGTSGVSGDWGRSGLYFEISRIHNKKAYPLNPLEVLR
ncbi:LysM peptidoglycan-binding domain-containing protein [Desulfurobacterium atlanticum]|uniref:Murein DD-endopeptidase MepM and murein hydrolase activator NlpD, contain LysM domain n=1 Tax=Desulfurobacterium atlanticum TaxID=240169 RepID=A0A238ZXZ2_9BACT|nr:LysM peptidoglycan-binding domain-containing protein [Desulfurobacterium atlanticum]SNR88245.1 Murein DD-endopeptidase MepM and murein hydrolase activator NlpD, contain LysM domain [Desulfurobacterium atlanticum]